MRAVLDPNVLVSAFINSDGTPAELLRRARDGAFEMVVSPLLLEELRRVLAYPKISERLELDAEERLGSLIETHASRCADPETAPPVRAPDPADDYLIVLAHAQRVPLVSGDGHLLGLSDRIPVFTARQFLELLEARGD